MNMYLLQWSKLHQNSWKIFNFRLQNVMKQTIIFQQPPSPSRWLFSLISLGAYVATNEASLGPYENNEVSPSCPQWFMKPGAAGWYGKQSLRGMTTRTCLPISPLNPTWEANKTALSADTHCLSSRRVLPSASPSSSWQGEIWPVMFHNFLESVAL